MFSALPNRLNVLPVLGWLLVALLADKSIAAPSLVPTPTPTPPVNAIGIVNVVSQIELTLNTLKDTQDKLTTNLQLAQAVGASLPGLGKSIQDRASANTTLLESGPSLYSLQRDREAWQVLAQSVSSAQLKLTDQANQANLVVQQLKDEQKVWQTTTQTAKSSAAPPEVLTRIQTVLTTIDQTSKSALSVQAQILALQTKLSDQNSIINSALDDISKAEVVARAKLFEQDHPPLWQESGASERSGAIAQENSTILDQWQLVVSYLAERINTVYVHVIVWIFLICALHWVRHCVPKAVADEVLQMPVVTATLFAILASSWLYPLAPRLLSSTLGIITIIPAAIILRRLIEPRLFPVLYAIVLAYFVDQCRNVLTPTGIASRFIFVFEILACCLFLLWLLQSKRLKQTSQIVYVNITFFGLIIAGFSNVFGYVHLAELLGNGALSSGYLTVVFYSAVLVIELLISSSFRMYPLTLLNMIRTRRELIYLRISKYVRWIAIIGWAFATLTRFSIQDTVWATVQAVLKTNIYWGWLTVPIGPLLAFGLTVWASFLLSRFVQFVLEIEIYPVLKLSRGMPYIASKYVHYGILTVGFLTAIEALGIDLTKFSLIGGAVGVGLGLAIQAPIAHFVAGVLLLFERSIKVGDSIQIDSTGITGTVEQVGIRSSVVRTPSGSQIILPNSTLITNAVISWSLNSQRLIEIPITVSPKADLRKVMDLLLEVATASDKVLQTPAPQALLVSVAGTALNFRLRVWSHADMDSMVVTSDLSIAVGRALARENIPLN